MPATKPASDSAPEVPAAESPATPSAPEVEQNLSELLKVRDKDGNTAEVSRRWLNRWPDDFEVIPAPETTPQQKEA